VGRWWRLGKYYRLASELAFARHQRVTVGSDEVINRRVDQLRKELRRLRQEL
jgi:hypothetical protein